MDDREAIRRAARKGQVAPASSVLPAPRQAAQDGPRRPAGRNLWRCHGCAEEFKAWETAQRHSDTTGHHRLEVIL